MGKITIVGLGPGALDHLTMEAWKVLNESEAIWLRTRHHPTVSELPDRLQIHSFDSIYEEREAFSEVYDTIAREVFELGERSEGVLYGVPGHPLVGEATVTRLLALAREAELSVHVVEGLSFVEPTLTALEVDALAGLQIYDAIELAGLYYPLLNPDCPVLIGQLYDRRLASDVKLTLMGQYPDEHTVALVHAAGTSKEAVEYLPLYEIDRRDEVSHLTSLFVPAFSGVTSFEGMQNTVAHLRAPGGCPWDREQTHESLRGSLLEEAYETVSAIDNGDLEGLREELGDLLLQVVIQTQIAIEMEEFRMVDVISGIVSKLKHRHPHVWGGRSVSGTGEVLRRWEELKKEEKGTKEGASSVLAGVPVALPALQQADTYSRRAARVGFDWSGTEGVVEKVLEELKELQDAETPEEKEAELGDLLFAVVNWARWLDLDPETALRQANARFKRRFTDVERMAEENGVNLDTLSIDELEDLWQKAKDKEA